MLSGRKAALTRNVRGNDWAGPDKRTSADVPHLRRLGLVGDRVPSPCGLG